MALVEYNIHDMVVGSMCKRYIGKEYHSKMFDENKSTNTYGGTVLSVSV